MRRVPVDDNLEAIPANGLIEICQQAKSADGNAGEQYATASLFALATDVDALQLGGRTPIVATADGLTTGLIPADAAFCQITSDTATKQVSLPAAVAGKHLYLQVDATGCEVISAVAADTLNNVVIGATNEAALVVGTLYSATYDGANWVMTGLTNLGAVEAPVVPDAL